MKCFRPKVLDIDNEANLMVVSKLLRDTKVRIDTVSSGAEALKRTLNVKYDVVSCGGTIDCGYVGSIRVKLYNLGHREYMVRKGQKIVQLVIIPCLQPELEIVDHLEETERNDNGFGSSGL